MNRARKKVSIVVESIPQRVLTSEVASSSTLKARKSPKAKITHMNDENTDNIFKDSWICKPCKMNMPRINCGNDPNIMSTNFSLKNMIDNNNMYLKFVRMILNLARALF